MNVFMRVYGFLKNDWEDVYQGTGKWNISVSTDFFGSYKENKYCGFKIQYSKFFNRFRVYTYGYRPEDHTMFTNYTNQVIRLNNNIKNAKS